MSGRLGNALCQRLHGRSADLNFTTLSEISEPSEAENHESSRAEDLIDRLAQ
jgi:hypothetical protein